MPFKPGQSGNPRGAPKKEFTWRTAFYKAMDRGGDNGIGIARQIVDMMIAKAIAGDLKAIMLIMDRTEGKPRQSVDMNVDQWPVIKVVEIG